MGTRFTYMCNKCGYQVMTSGDHDYGMLAVTDTYTCTDCKKIVEITVGEYGVTFSMAEVREKKKNKKTDLDFYICPECGSESNLIKWDQTKRPCPKCDGKMEKDPHGKEMLWD